MENVLDSSAVLAFLSEEDGHEAVLAAMDAGSGLCAVNGSEIVSVMMRRGVAGGRVRSLVWSLPIEWVDVDQDLAWQAGEMILATKPFGLSLGDRMCLALGLREGVRVVTAERRWLDVAGPLGVQVDLIR